MMGQKLYNFTMLALAAVSFLLIGCKDNPQKPLAIKANTKQVVLPRIMTFIFGRFCGECGTNCAPMFSLNRGGNAITLWGDFDDNYFNNRKFNFKTDLNTLKKITIANEICDKLPNSLLLDKSNKSTYGCPDCTDGCGIYVCFTTDDGRRKEYFLDLSDTNDRNSPISKEILEYSQFINSKIELLKK